MLTIHIDACTDKELLQVLTTDFRLKSRRQRPGDATITEIVQPTDLIPFYHYKIMTYVWQNPIAMNITELRQYYKEACQGNRE